MPNREQPTPQAPPASKKTIAGVMGSVALAAALMAGLTTLEGKRNVGYRDIVGIPTNCRGNTRDVIVGKRYSDAECDRIDEGQAIAHAEQVKACTPRVTGYQLEAATLLAYNIGGPTYCRSTIARRFNAGDLRGGCDAFRAYNRAGGRVVRGLVNRREFERSICLKGLTS
jgi:lysozyme